MGAVIDMAEARERLRPANPFLVWFDLCLAMGLAFVSIPFAIACSMSRT